MNQNSNNSSCNKNDNMSETVDINIVKPANEYEQNPSNIMTSSESFLQTSQETEQQNKCTLSHVKQLSPYKMTRNVDTNSYKVNQSKEELYEEQEQEENHLFIVPSTQDSILEHSAQEEPSTSMQSQTQLWLSSSSISSSELNYKRERVQLNTQLIKCKRQLSEYSDKLSELAMQVNTLEKEKQSSNDQLRCKVKEVEQLQEQLAILKASQMHLVSVKNELQGERNELQRQLQEAWNTICEMYKANGVRKLENEFVATTIENNKNKNNNDKNKNSNNVQHQSKEQEALAQLVESLHNHITSAMTSFAQSTQQFALTKQVTGNEENSEELAQFESEYINHPTNNNNNKDNNQNNVLHKLWRCERDFDALIHCIDTSFAKMHNTNCKLKEQLHHKATMEKQERLEHTSNALQEQAALQSASDHTRRLLLHAKESVERTEHELQSRKLHLAELLHVSPEWNLIEHAIQQLNLSLTLSHIPYDYKNVSESINRRRTKKIKATVRNSAYHNNPLVNYTQVNKENAVRHQAVQKEEEEQEEEELNNWITMKAEITPALEKLLKTLSSMRNLRERTSLVAKLTALQRLICLVPTSSHSHFMSEQKICFNDIVAETITFLCECACYFVNKSKTLVQERNAVNRFICTSYNSSKVNVPWTASTQQENIFTSYIKTRRQNTCRLKRIMNVVMLCLWWLKKCRERRVCQSSSVMQSVHPENSYSFCGDSRLMKADTTYMTTQKEQSNDDSYNSNTKGSIDKVEESKSQVSDVFASEVLEVIMTLDKRVQGALERHQ